MGKLACVPQGFDRGVALQCAGLIASAYAQFRYALAVPPQAWAVPAEFDLLAEFSGSLPRMLPEKFGFVARRRADARVFVVFRGTADAANWLANLDFIQAGQRNGWGRAEAGFSQVYDECEPAISAALQAAGARQPAIVTGHSLGGALATLCAADIAATGNVAPVLYTFASPRAGDEAFAARFNQGCTTAFRVVNTEDIVNTVPLAATALAAFRLTAMGSATGLLNHLPDTAPLFHDPIARVQRILDGMNYQHVGVPVDFTEHKGNVVDNHKIETYLEAL